MPTNSKNTGPFLAFTPQWFARWQVLLLWLLNTPLVRIWFRWVLRIHRDIPAPIRIVELGPSSITYNPRPVWDSQCWHLRLTLDARTHPKFAKRMYYAFRPFWWTLHFWDWLIADRFVPEWSFGFLTLTAFPAPGANSPVDGEVSRQNTDQDLPTIQSGSGTDVSNTGTDINVRLVSSTTTNQYNTLARGICCFDTSSIGAGSSISDATLSLRVLFSANALGSPALHICGATPASNAALVASDYSQLQSTSFASIAYGSISSSVYNDFALNSSGISNLNLSGISGFGIRLDWDINNSFTGTWVSGFQTSNHDVFSADNSGTGDDPKLVVNYTTSPTEPFPAGYAPRHFNSLIRL